MKIQKIILEKKLKVDESKMRKIKKMNIDEDKNRKIKMYDLEKEKEKGIQKNLTDSSTK